MFEIGTLMLNWYREKERFAGGSWWVRLCSGFLKWLHTCREWDLWLVYTASHIDDHMLINYNKVQSYKQLLYIFISKQTFINIYIM